MDRGFILGFILMIGFIVVIVACGKSIKPSDESRGPIILESKEESALYKDDNITEDDYGKSTNRMNNKKIKNKTNSSNINIYSLKDLIEYTLQHSPTLKSAHKQIDSSIYAEKQADKTFQLNPKIQGMVNVYRDSPSQIKGSSYEIMYMQPLEIGGQQEGRRTIGKYKRKLSEDKLFALRMQVLAKVKYLYYNGLVLKKKWESINQVKSFYDKIVGVTREKRKERNISDPKALIIDILYNRFMNEYDKVKEELDNNLYDLKSEIYYEKSQSFDLKGKIFYDSLPYNIKELMKLAGNSRIELLQRHNALNIKNGEIALEESKLFPQIDVFVRYKKEMKEQMYDIGVAFPLPIFNTNSNNVEAREKEKESIQIEIQAVTETVKRDILVALRKIRLALSKINRFERSILKDSERSKLLIKEFYSMGGTEFITLLEQEKVYQEMILSYWSAVQEYYFAFFLLEKAIGRVIFYSNRNEWESINFKTIYNKNYK